LRRPRTETVTKRLARVYYKGKVGRSGRVSPLRLADVGLARA